MPWLFAVALLPLASCVKPPPTGQVLADIDNEDITRRDLAAEAQANGNADEASPALLEQVVERKLLVRAAQRDGIEHTPEYLAEMRRQREFLLSRLYVQRLARGVPAPTSDEIARYIAAHPFAFDNRVLLATVQFTAPATAAVRAALTNAIDIRAVNASLAAQGVRAELSEATLDSATLPEDTAQRLAQAAANAVVVIASAGGITAYQVKASQPAPVRGDVAVAAAVRAINMNRLSQEIASRIEAERRQAHIRYQVGLGPSTS